MKFFTSEEERPGLKQPHDLSEEGFQVAYLSEYAAKRILGLLLCSSRDPPTERTGLSTGYVVREFVELHRNYELLFKQKTHCNYNLSENTVSKFLWAFDASKC